MTTNTPDPTPADLEAMWSDVAETLGVLFVDVLPARPEQLVMFAAVTA